MSGENMLLLSKRLAEMAKPSRFVRRGSAMFRVSGDGVLQILKFQTWRTGDVELLVGLQSMYSELKPQWFTSGGCIPRYSVVNIIGQRYCPAPFSTDTDPSPSEQLHILSYSGLPWLDSLKTQQQLIDGICFLETSWGGTILKNDEQKIAPYLYCKNYSAAEHVLEAILEQHEFAYRANRTVFSEEKYLEYIESHVKENEALECLLNAIHRRDDDFIQTYLATNYANNTNYAKFCLK